MRMALLALLPACLPGPAVEVRPQACEPCADMRPSPVTTQRYVRPKMPPQPNGLLVGTAGGCPANFATCLTVDDEVRISRYLLDVEMACGGSH